MPQGVIRKLQEAGHHAFWVGGCVRDSLLGRKVSDWDVATSALPDEVLAIFPDARVVGPRFGIVAVRDGEELVEVATFRRDCGYSDGRRPDRVTYTSDPRVDVLRRDFTVNAILHDPVSDSRARLRRGRARPAAQAHPGRRRSACSIPRGPAPDAPGRPIRGGSRLRDRGRHSLGHARMRADGLRPLRRNALSRS